MKFQVRKHRPTPTVIIIALIDVLIVLVIFLLVTTTFKQQAALKALIEEHVRLTYSVVGKTLLADWDAAAGDFVLFTPKPQA